MSRVQWSDISDIEIEQEEEIDEFEKELVEMEEEKMIALEKELVEEECIEGLDDIVVSPKLEEVVEIPSSPIVKKVRGRPRLNLTTEKVVVLENKKRGCPRKISTVEESVNIIDSHISIKEEVKVLDTKEKSNIDLDQLFNHLHLVLDDIKIILEKL